MSKTIFIISDVIKGCLFLLNFLCYKKLYDVT